jgi:tetratricopeptide (TPR) repeat protein
MHAESPEAHPKAGLACRFITDAVGRARNTLPGFQSLRHRITMVWLRYILPMVVLLVVGGWLYGEDIPQPDFAAAIQNLRKTLSQLQTEIKDLQSSVKELARVKDRAGDAKEATKEKALRPSAQAAGTTDGESTGSTVWQRAREAYEIGRHLEDLKAYGTAIEFFTEVIYLDPKNDSAFLHRGYAHYYLADFAMAVSDISYSIALQPNNSRAYAMRASALASIGRTNDAIADATQAIQRDPGNAENYLLRANFHQQIGQAQEALNDYGQVIQMGPESPKAYLGRAAILRTHGQLPQSLSDCYKAIQLNPADSAAYVCRAQFYLATGAPQPALEDINRAMLIGYDPAETATLLSAAQKMIDIKASPAPAPPQPLVPGTPPTTAAPTPTPQPAAQSPTAPAAAQVVAWAPPPVALHQLGQSLNGVAGASLQQPEVPPAPVVPSSQEPRTAHNANRFYREGRYLSEQEKFDEAVQAFGQAIQIDPTHALALNARGYAHLRLRRYQDTIDDCSQAIRLNPSYANAYLNRSVAKRALGDRVGAREDLRRATELENIAQATLSKPSTRP